MAKAIAECTCKTCGAKFEKFSFKRNRREADRWEEWAINYYDECDECAKKRIAAEREKAAEEAAKAAKEAGLPELKGTPAQVKWAEQIRYDGLEVLNKGLEYYEEKAKTRPDHPKVLKALKDIQEIYDIICRKDAADFWIDNRFAFMDQFSMQEMIRKLQDEMIQSDVPEDVKEEATLVPENQSKGEAEIVVTDNLVTAKYPKDDDFRAVVKGCGFRWSKDSRAWMMGIPTTTGSAVDRAAELANALLRAGFAVMCRNPEVREKAVSGDFEPRCDRWVLYCTGGEYYGWLAIDFPRGNDDLYHAARAIKGAKYSYGAGVCIPVANHAMVEDFANLYDFRISPAAQQAIEKFEAQKASAVAAAEPAATEHQDKLAEILNSSDDILPDLRDE